MKNKLLSLVMGVAFATQMITAQVPSYIPTNGLASWWSFSGNANDASTNANNGAVNGATLTTDRFGNTDSAYGFSNNSISVPSTNTLSNFSSGQTISFWMNLPQIPSPTNSIRPIIEKYNQNLSIESNGNAGQGYSIQFDGDGVLHYSIKNGLSLTWGDCTIPPTKYSTNKYYHVAFVNDNDSIRGYINSVKIVSTKIPTGSAIGINTLPLMIGNTNQVNPAYPIPPFNGTLDDIGIWNRVLNQDEINNLYSANICYQNITVTDTLVINTGILGFNPITYNNTVKIYPNPTNDNITIDCGNLANVNGQIIKIYNALGEEVFSGAMNTQQYQVPLNTWGGQGVYFVKIYDVSNNLLNTKKIILQ